MKDETKVIFHFSSEFDVYELDEMIQGIVNSKFFSRSLIYEIETKDKILGRVSKSNKVGLK